MARLRARVERAAMLHRQAAAMAAATASAMDAYSPATAPAEQYAEQHELAARLRAASADLVPGWLGASLDAMPAAAPVGDTGVPAFVRIGYAHPVDDARFPAIAPLLGTGHLAIDADARDPRVAGLLRSVLLRLVATAVPGTVRIRVVDAACAGETTAPFADAPNAIPAPVMDHTGLRVMLAEADQWIRNKADADQYLLLVIASLPELTDGSDLARIAQLARTGVAHRLHLIVAGWPPPPLTAETTQAPLPFGTHVSLRNPYAWMGDPPGVTFSGTGIGPSRLNSPVYLDSDPPLDLIRRVCGELVAIGQPAVRSPWSPPASRWAEYVTAAQQIDAARREASSVVTEQTAVLKRARAELATVRKDLSAQQRHIGALLGDGRPLPLQPMPGELSAAGAALARLAQAASTRAAAARAARTVGGMRPAGGTAAGYPTGADTDLDAPTAPVATTRHIDSQPGQATLSTTQPGAWPTATGQRPAGPVAHPGFANSTAAVQMTSPPRPGINTPPAPISGPGGRPSGPPISGVGHPAYANTGAFPVVSAPPHTGYPAPISGPPTTANLPGPPSASPRLPEAARALLTEARATLARADAELSQVDARISRSPNLRNAVVYLAYALVFAVMQLPLLTSLTRNREMPALITAPCGLVMVGLSFALAWITIGFLYSEPGGQPPPRTPVLGAVISLIATAPGLLTLLWMAFSATGR